MVEITLVRHGQANTGATDEESYDKLSDLGRQQARWVGEYFAQTGQKFDHVFAGSLNRQRDTAGEISQIIGGDVAQDERLNEIDYFGLADSMFQTKGIPVPTTGEEFAPHVPMTFDAWIAGEIGSAKETYPEFETRVNGFLNDARALGGRVLLVSSGGVISKVKRRVMGLDTQQWAQALLSTRNSSIHRYHLFLDELHLDVFNAIPHLDHVDRAHARTYT